MIISITGTPGTGKTYFAKKFADKTGFRYFELNKFIKEERLYDSYDKKAMTYDVDIKKLSKLLNMLLKKYRINPRDKQQLLLSKQLGMHINNEFQYKKLLNTLHTVKNKKSSLNNIIIDSHLSHYLESDYCFIMKSDIKLLNKRLQNRKYSKKKIKENIESEIFEICLDESRKLKRQMIIIRN